ncbi:ABC transporter permease [Oricola sp.]|uniref:ABC transporter permease n=1 Tax=Oricola sp. TaxID=1979950 RepID=UPI003BA958DA
MPPQVSNLGDKEAEPGKPDLLVAPDLPPVFPGFEPRSGFWALIRANKAVAFGVVVFVFMSLAALFAPLIVSADPFAISPLSRLKPISYEHPFGTDMLGRDLFARVFHGARVSLTVGLAVAFFSAVIGLAVGLISGYVRWLDGFIMRTMDGLMSIPGILLAIALMALSGGSIQNVILAITVVEIPRVARLIRGVVLSLREQTYVEAAIAAGSSSFTVIVRHILPNTLAPLTVQATYVCAAAMLLESILSFIGAGIPPSVPSWGNIMADGRSLWQLKPSMIFIPATALSITILAINLIGDGLRDNLDPRMARRF